MEATSKAVQTTGCSEGLLRLKRQFDQAAALARWLEVGAPDADADATVAAQRGLSQCVGADAAAWTEPPRDC